MTGRSAAVQGGLAALGLLAAHLTWQREPERAPGEVTVVDASKADVPRIRFEDDANILAVERRSENGEPGVWVHLEPKAPKAAPPKASDKATPAGPPAPPETPAYPPRDVRGNADGLKLIDRFAPLVSPRAFGVMQGDKLKELGLDAPTRHLEVVVRGDTRKYDVGIALNAQNGEAFLRDARDGRIYLMPRQLLGELSNGKRLVDPRLHTFETKEFDKVAVTVGGKTREWIHLGRENFQTDAYAPAKTPDKHDQTAKNWLDEVWRTFPMEVLGKDEVPKGGPPKVAFRIDYTEKGKPVGWIEIARGGTSGDGMSSEPQDNIFARSEHSVGWARLHSGDMLISDAEKLFASP
ncbi:MAG TPA: hypothetical protein VHL80_18825 [Polyangia bacterium]|nr:hypothetical protein [Polyangia bacterium]